MNMTRLLSTTLLGVAASLPLAAQSTATTSAKMPDMAQAAQATESAPRDNVLHVPGMAKQELMPQGTQNSAPQLPGLIVLRQHVEAAKGPANRSLLARTEGTCYSLREKRFRAPDAESNMPQPYGSATCTPASELLKKRADVESEK